MSNPLAELMDQLCIIHHKLDVLLHVAGVPVPPMSEGHICPGCSSPIEYTTDFLAKCIIRRCQCGHKKLAPLVGLEDIGDTHGNDYTIRNGRHPSEDSGSET